MKQKQMLSDEERWIRHKTKYQNQNLISSYLVNNFYKSISQLVSRFEKTDQILEVGCGTGESSLRINKMLSGQYMEVSDINATFIRKLQESDFPLPAKTESVLSLEHDNKSFDVVFLLEVLEHLDDYQKALSEIFRVSRKYVVVSVPNEPYWRILNMVRGKYWGELGNTPTHVNHWSAQGIKDLIGQYGLLESYKNPLPWSIILARVSDDNLPLSPNQIKHDS